MFYIFNNEIDNIKKYDYFHETYKELLLKYCFESSKRKKTKIIFLIIVFIIIILYYNFQNFEYLILLNHQKKDEKEESNYKIMEINNKVEEIYYEDNTDYSKFFTNIKAIAIYYPNIYLSKFRQKILSEPNSNQIIEHYGCKTGKNSILNKIDNKEVNNRILKSYDFHDYNFIKNQINLAKSHGLYGFGFYIFWFSGIILFDKYIKIFLEVRRLNYKFLFILKHKFINNYENSFDIKKYNRNHPEKIILKIKKFLLDERYIKYDSKPIICIDNYKNNSKVKSTIISWRNEAKNNGIGDIFIIASLKDKNITSIKESKIFDAGYESLPKYLFSSKLLVNKKENYRFYSGLIYRDISFEKQGNFPIYRGSTLENDFKIKNLTIFGEYHPEYFYIMNKMIINWTITNYNETNRFIFINSWNNYYEGAYLEPENQFGYGTINALSKSLFNISFKKTNYNLENLYNKSFIAVQAHVFYDDLVDEIIEKTNNIPVKFDLYVTTNSPYKKNIIRQKITSKSKSNYYEIKIVKNQGRDILPLLRQMGKVINKYKYFCHIHTKKTLENPNYGLAWRKYLYKNLLGSTELITDILSDFENNQMLGFIFPETFYEAKEAALKLNALLINSINYLLKRLLNGYKMGNCLDFPAGDMFWAKTKAVYQIFEDNFKNDIFLEGKGPQTILFAIERIWLYIVKYNGYYYKKTCEYY